MRLAAAWLALAPAAVMAGASDLPAALDEAVAMLAQRIEQTEETDDDRLEELAGRTLAELRAGLREAGVDEPLVRALVPEGNADEESEPHALARLRRQRRRLARFAESARREPAATVDAAERARLETILAQPVFHGEAAAPGPLQRLRRWLSRRWNELIRTMFGVVEANVWLVAGLFGALVIAALAGVGYLIARTLRSGYVAPAAQRVHEPADRTSLELPALLVRARSEAQAGRGVEALRLLVLAATIALRSRGALPDEPGLTDLEGLRVLEVTAPGELRGDFGDLTALHDRGVYGGRGVEGPAIERAMRLTRRILEDAAGLAP